MDNPVLIDRNRMLKQLADCKSLPKMRYTLKDIQDFILAQPTAYDTDKVVKRLEGLETYKQTVTMEKHPFCASEIETVSKKKAIEIVKGGGINE